MDKPKNRHRMTSRGDASQHYVGNVDARLAVVHDTATISDHAIVGSMGEWRGRRTVFAAHVGACVVIREFARVHAGCERSTIIGEGTLIMSGAHVGHDAHIGEGCDIAPNAVIGGLVTIGDRVKIGMGAVVNPHVTIGSGARIGSGAVVNRDVPAGETWVGVPARRIK